MPPLSRGGEGELGRQHLFHQQAGGDRLEGVVDRLVDGLVGGVGLGDEVGEPGAGLAGGVAGGAADDLHHLGQRGAVADGERVLAPDPVEALLGHAEGDDDVDVVAVVGVRRVLEGAENAVAAGAVVVDQVGDPQRRPVLPLDQLKAGGGIGALPGAERLHDVLGFANLVAEAFAGVNVGNMDDSLFRRVEHLGDRVDVAAGIEVVADVERLQPLVAVELLVIGVGDGLETRLVLRHQHRLGVAAEVGAGHGDDVHAVARHQRAQVGAEPVVGVGADVVELVDGDQPLVQGVDAELIEGKAEGGVGAHQHRIGGGEEASHRRLGVRG